MLSLHKVIINSNDGNSLSNKQRRHAKSVDIDSDFGDLPAGRQSVFIHGIIRVTCLNSCVERRPPIR